MANNPLSPTSFSVSAHPLMIGSIGATGPLGSELSVVQGPVGSSGPTGPVGLSGPSGFSGPVPIGITYSSGQGGDPEGGKPHHLIVRYSDGTTYDAGYFRGETGETRHWIVGENIGSAARVGHPATGGSWFQEAPNGKLILKGLTGGGGVRVIDEGDSIRIAYDTFDAVQVVNGVKGQLVFMNQDSAGNTGMSGATFTNYYPGPTYSLDVTTIGYKEIAGFLDPYRFDEETYTMIYRINPNELLTFKSAKNKTSTGNTILINPKEDYRRLFGGPLLDNNKAPFYRIIDSSAPSDDVFSVFFGEKTSCGFTLMINADNKTERLGTDSLPVKNKHITFPSNWNFPNNANPRQDSGIDIIQFISIGDVDPHTNKTEWYGLYQSSQRNPFNG